MTRRPHRRAIVAWSNLLEDGPGAAPVARAAARRDATTTGPDDGSMWQVDLVDGPGDELAFVRALRTVARVSLAEALDIHGYASRTARVTIVAGIPLATASQLAWSLEAEGIVAQMTPSTTRTPMVCRPRAHEVRVQAFAPSRRTRPLR